MSDIVTIFNTADNIIGTVDGDPGLLNDANGAAQLTAIGASFAIPTATLGQAAAIVTTEEAAAALALDQFAADVQANNGNAALGDALSFVGDSINAAAAVAAQQGVAGKALATDMLGYGDGITLLGLAFKDGPAVVQGTPVAASELQTETSEYSAQMNATGSAATPYFVAMNGNAGTAWGNIETGLVSILSNIETGASVTGTAFTTAMNNTQGGLALLLTDSGATAANSTDTVSNNNAYTLASSSGSGISSGTASASGSTISTTTTGNDGAPNVTESETFGSSSDVYSTAGTTAGGTTVYSATETVPQSGQVTESISGQDYVSDLSGASIDVAVLAAATVAGNANTIAAAAGSSVSLASGSTSNTVTGNDASVSLDAGAQAAVDGANNAVTLAANAALSLAAGSTGNTVNVDGAGASINTTGNDGTVASGTTVLAGPVENVTYDTMEVSVGSSDTATITGTDGSMEISNDVGGSGSITNTINWNAGGSQVQVLSGLPGGETSSSDNYSGANGNGTNTSDAINYSGGYSELQTYSGLPSGVEEVIDSWSGLNLTGTEGSIVTNNTNNSSQIETFDPGIGVTTSVADYTGLNASGTETQNTDNWTGGGSQLQLLADLPSGDSEILDNYQDADAQGKLVSTAWDYTNDTSEILLYTPDLNVLDDAEIFSALNGGGAEQYAVVNYTGVPIGSEYQQFAGVPAGTLENIVGYAGASLTGSIKYNVANYTDDYSQIELLAPASGINSTDQSFDGLNGSGSPTAEQIYNANNTTDLITYDYNGNANAAMDTFYQGSTELGYGLYTLSGQFGGGTYNGLSIGLFTDDDGYAVNIDGFDPYDGTDDYDPVDDAAVGGFGSGGRFGLGNTLSSNDSAITLTDGESATITGSGNTVNAASDDTITMSDSGPNTVALAGNTTSLADSGAGDTYSVTGQSNYLNVSNATIQVADNVAVEIDGNTSTLALGNDDTVILDAGSYLMNATLSGSGSTLTDNGFGDTILVGGSSNTIDLSAGGNAGDALAGNLVTFNGTGEQIALSGLETITLQSGTQTTLIGSDGTMTVNNDASGGLIRNTIDWNAGGSEVQTFTPSASGLTEDAIGYSGGDGSGNQLYEQQASTDSSGNITAFISGQGAVSNISNASISLAGNATATLNGNGNTVTVGNDGTLNTGSGALLNTITLSGDNAVLNDAGSEDTVTLSGASDTAVLSGANMNGSAVTVSGSNASVEFTAASNDNVTFGLDAMGTLLLQMAQDYTGTVAGLVGGDGIDFANFQFSNGATISNVTGSGAAGTDTVLTISDDGINAQILLMNQYTAQYGASASAYALTADSTQPNAGTLLQLAAAH